MSRIFIYIGAFILLMHGLVHLLYFMSCRPITELEEVPYKTTLLSGRRDVAPGGIRLFGLLRLIATMGFVVAVIGMAVAAEWRGSQRWLSWPCFRWSSPHQIGQSPIVDPSSISSFWSWF